MPEQSGEPAGDLLIGVWRFCPAMNRLQDGDDVVHLEPKAARVLQLLAARAGQPVSRQELLDSGWAGLVVSDDALTQVIIKLRKAFGDSSRSPRYIQTIPKRGYCLVAEVQAVEVSPDEKRVPPRQVARPGPAGGRAWLLLVALLLATLAWLLLPETSVQPPDEAVSAGPSSIAVIPFSATSGGEREQRFARGITADLNTDLSGLSDLRVINPALDSGAEIGARYLVSGSVQQDGGDIAVHVRLLEAANRQQLWSQRYEQSLDDLFDIQHAISQNVVRQLSLQVNAAEMQRLASRYTPSLQAYEDFLRGQSQLLLRQQEANAEARRWYREAIEQDPNFARAYAGLALSYAADYRNHWVDDGDKALSMAQEMAQTGVQIDPTISEVYWVLGYVAAQKRRHDVALKYLQRALQLDRSYADAYALMGGINTYRGQPQQSVEQLRDALRLNQNAGYLYYLLLGRAYFFTAHYEQAVINLRESLARNPVNLEARLYLLATARSTGDSGTAEWEVEEIRAIDPDFKARDWLDTYPMTDQRQGQLLLEILESAGF